MTTAATRIITAAIVAFALASAILATPASATGFFPTDMARGSQHAGASAQCADSRFGCAVGHR